MSSNPDSYCVDMADEIDSAFEIIADEYGVSLETAQRIIADRDRAVRTSDAEVLGNIIGMLLSAGTNPVILHSLALASGLGHLNGIKSEADVARQLGVTRSLVSHYVIGWRDILSGKTSSFDNLTFRAKKNECRKVYANQTKSAFVAAKMKAYEKRSKNN